MLLYYLFLTANSLLIMVVFFVTHRVGNSAPSPPWFCLCVDVKGEMVGRCIFSAAYESNMD